MLQLNNTPIRLKALRITVSQELATADASGATSSTAAAETGSKAKVLTVFGELAFVDAQVLSQLWKLAEATEAGARVVYRISNHTATALGIKQVRFSSKIEAVEQQNSRKWLISFNLTEHLSESEQKAQRETLPAAQQQGAETSTPNPEAEVPPNTAPELTGFWSVLKNMDDSLA